MAKYRTQNRPYDGKGNPNSYFSDTSSDNDTSKGLSNGPSNESSLGPSNASFNGSSNVAPRSHTTGTSYTVDNQAAMQTGGNGNNQTMTYASSGVSHQFLDQDLFGIGAHLDGLGGTYPATLDDEDLGLHTTPREGGNGSKSANTASTEMYNPELPSQTWLHHNGLGQDWMGGPGPALRVNDVDTTMITPPRNNESAQAMHLSNDSTVLRRAPTVCTQHRADSKDTMSSHTRKGGFSSDNMLHGLSSFGDFTPRDEEKRFRLNEEFTMGPGDNQPCTENEFMARIGACSRKASDKNSFESGRPRRQQLEDKTLGCSTYFHQPGTPTKTAFSNRVIAQSPVESKAGDSHDLVDVVMMGQYRQEPDAHRQRPRPTYSEQNGTSFANGLDLHNKARMTQSEKNARVHAMIFDRIWGPSSGAGNEAEHENAQFGRGSLLYDDNLIPRGVRQDFLANPTAYISDEQVNAILSADTGFDLGYLPGSFHDRAVTTAGDNPEEMFHGTTVGGHAELGMMRDQSGLGGTGEWDFVATHQDQAGVIAKDDTFSSDSSSEFVYKPLPMPTLPKGPSKSTVKEEGDGPYVDPEEEDSEYADEPMRKRKRVGPKNSTDSEKLNKDGQPRKSRAPRAPLRRWDENDLIKALIGIVWACGEAGLPIPFGQAAQLIDDTCTASALQQAILKLHAQMLKEGKQLPKIKMHWPKKGGDKSTVVFRDAGKVPRRKPTMRRPTQSFIITLKRAYVEADRAALVSPYAPQTDSKYKWHSLDPRALNGWAALPRRPPLPPHLQSRYAKTIPTADYLPPGFSRDQDPFQNQATRGTLPPYSHSFGSQDQSGSPGHMTEQQYYDCVITSAPLNPQNLTADQVINGRTRLPKVNQARRDLLGNDTPRDAQQDTPQMASAASSMYGSTPSRPPTYGGAQTLGAMDRNASFSSTQAFNMSGMEQQPRQAAAISPTYGGTQTQGVPEGRNRISSYHNNNDVLSGEFVDGYVPETPAKDWEMTGIIREGAK